MRTSLRALPILAVTCLVTCSTTLRAADPVTTADFDSEESQPSLIQRISHLFQPGTGHGHGGIVHYGLFSPHYALWQSPDLYADDMRCRPTRWAPRGYGWPKKTACNRLDYAPYGVESTHSHHGPALWPRTFPTPCCDCGQSAHCDICGGGARYAPRP